MSSIANFQFLFDLASDDQSAYLSHAAKMLVAQDDLHVIGS